MVRLGRRIIGGPAELRRHEMLPERRDPGISDGLKSHGYRVLGTPDADPTLGGHGGAPVMRKYASSPATHYSSRDSLFLVVIAVVSLICGVVSFYAWRAEHNPALTASAEDEAPRLPLPAGPRKYQ
jgi:hypothetical protein